LPFNALFKSSDTSTFCSPYSFDLFTGGSGFDSQVSDFINDYVVDGFIEREYKLRTGKGESISSQYTLTAIQANDVAEKVTDHQGCNLFDVYTPFNCISCHKGYALNIQTKKCETVANPINFCEEYVSLSKLICIRCETGYILDYGINTDIFNTPTQLSNRICFWLINRGIANLCSDFNFPRLWID
jgi:hypothetical protein